MEPNEITNKEEICRQLKNISEQNVNQEWNVLRAISQTELENLSGRSKLGCNIIDHFFFQQRLETIGNKGIHFFGFVENIEYYKTKKYVQNLLEYCEKNNRYQDNLIKKYYYCYGLCFGRINAFKITNALQIYNKFTPTRVLDPFAGFGGRLVGCLLKNIHYTGIDLNIDLKPAYDRLLEYVRVRFPTQNPNNSCSPILLFENAENVDYSTIDYDMVFTSPPYYNIEIYQHSIKKTEQEWDVFYRKVFDNLWQNLKPNGHFIININDKIYNKILVPMFGQASEMFPLKKSTRNVYVEFIYVWCK